MNLALEHGMGTKNIILLVGPKGTGKSYVGRLLDAHGLTHFLEIEPIVMEALERCKVEGIPYTHHGYGAVEVALKQCLKIHPSVAIELTGASPHTSTFIERISSRERVVYLRVECALKICAERIRARDQSRQIPTSEEVIMAIHEISSALEWPWDAVIRNDGSVSDADMVQAVGAVL